jgi:hypothetical protein
MKKFTGEEKEEGEEEEEDEDEDQETWANNATTQGQYAQ